MPGSFITVACPDCDNEQTIFSKASTAITCASCDATVATPTGGKAELAGEIVDVVEAR